MSDSFSSRKKNSIATPIYMYLLPQKCHTPPEVKHENFQQAGDKRDVLPISHN